MKEDSSLPWPRHRSRAKEDLSSLASASLKGEGGLILAEACLLVLGAHTRGETCCTQGRFVLSMSKHLGQSCALVPTPEERLAKSSTVSSPRCLNTKATSAYLCALGAHARGEAYPKVAPFRPRCVYKHQGNQCTWCPRPRRGMLKAVSYRPRCV